MNDPYYILRALSLEAYLGSGQRSAKELVLRQLKAATQRFFRKKLHHRYI